MCIFNTFGHLLFLISLSGVINIYSLPMYLYVKHWIFLKNLLKMNNSLITLNTSELAPTLENASTIVYNWDWSHIMYYYTFKSLWFLFGITGNSLTCTAILKFENLQTMANYNIVSLAVADLIVGFVASIVSLAVKILKIKNIIWLSVCSLNQLLIYVGASFNVMRIFWTAVDHFIFIHKPLH